jgi:hypothetical protein
MIIILWTYSIDITRPDVVLCLIKKILIIFRAWLCFFWKAKLVRWVETTNSPMFSISHKVHKFPNVLQQATKSTNFPMFLAGYKALTLPQQARKPLNSHAVLTKVLVIKNSLKYWGKNAFLLILNFKKFFQSL